MKDLIKAIFQLDVPKWIKRVFINYFEVNKGKVGLYIDGNYKVDTRGFITIKNIDEFHSLNDLDKIVYITNKDNINTINSEIASIKSKNSEQDSSISSINSEISSIKSRLDALEAK